MTHWTEIDFENWLYGLKEQDPHAAQCSECRAEMERLRAVQSRTAEQPEVPQAFLAAQRRSIYERLEQGPAHRLAAWRWVLSTAMLLAIVAGLMVPRWHKAAPPISDEQLFSDLSAMEQTNEPKAIAPMHNLFEQ